MHTQFSRIREGITGLYSGHPLLNQLREDPIRTVNILKHPWYARSSQNIWGTREAYEADKSWMETQFVAIRDNPKKFEFLNQRQGRLFDLDLQQSIRAEADDAALPRVFLTHYSPTLLDIGWLKDAENDVSLANLFVPHRHCRIADWIQIASAIHFIADSRPRYDAENKRYHNGGERTWEELAKLDRRFLNDTQFAALFGGVDSWTIQGMRQNRDFTLKYPEEDFAFELESLERSDHVFDIVRHGIYTMFTQRKDEAYLSISNESSFPLRRQDQILSFLIAIGFVETK